MASLLVASFVTVHVDSVSAATGWNIVSSPNLVGQGSDSLLGVSCPGTANCTAVGQLSQVDGLTGLIMHWDGSAWSQQQQQNPTNALSSQFNAVACPSTTMCVAVGRFFDYKSPPQHTLVEQSSGSTWSVVPSPDVPNALDNDLSAVRCPSTTSCMAVGSSEASSGDVVTLAEQWNGSTWSIVPTPNAAATDNKLLGLACPSATNCTAVGDTQTGSTITTLAEHWDGTNWTIQSTPDLSLTSSQLLAVACPNATTCFAAGNAQGSPLIEQFNGTTWARQTTPMPSGATSAFFNGVTCRSATKCFAVGSQRVNGQFRTLAERWNGTNWAVQTTANPQSFDFLATVVCPAGTSCFAVGRSQPSFMGQLSNLVLHFDGTSWTSQAIPNPSRGIENDLHSVSCLSTTDCTAVGSTDSGTQPHFLAEHWNGTAWSLETTNLGAGISASGVSCVTTSFCVAVGSRRTATASQTLALQWNGSQWSVVSTPSSPGAGLTGIACFTTMACTAVGSQIVSHEFATLVERWDGTSWTVQASPNLAGTTHNLLVSVSCATATDCMAVGNAQKPGTGIVTLAERWNGATWTVVASPNSTTTAPIVSLLEAVSCTNFNRCTATGTGRDSGGHNFSLAERWNGTTWTIQTTANAASSTSDNLRGVVCTSATSCVAVGSFDNSSGDVATLAEQWNGTTWSVQTTPNPAGETNPQLFGLSCIAATCFSIGSGSQGTLDRTLVEKLS